MAKLKQNPLIGDIQGMIGDLVIVNYKPGVKIIRKRPVRTAPPTEGEKANQAKMRGAIAYAKGVWAEQPELKLQYNAAAHLENRRGFDMAKADFLTPPSVEDVDLSHYSGQPGESVRVRTGNKFGLKALRIRILNLSGAVLEEGAAKPDRKTWLYQTTSPVPAGQTVVIEVSATDYPGHTTIKKVDHACGPRA